MNAIQTERIIYQEDRVKVLADLKEGRLDYLDLADWTFQDKFFAFLLGVRFFEICGASYPSPRTKEEVALWFLLACAVQMKLHTTAAYERLPGLLRSGAVLSRVKFNVGGVHGGFNNKNKKQRSCPIHHDTARKFFKDTNACALRDWHNGSVQQFIDKQGGFDQEGIFLLDQTHVVVPENEHYQGAVNLPVDEHGQWIDTTGMGPEQKKAVKYRPCYALSELLHIHRQPWSFTFAGYQWGAGNTDELVQAESLLEKFVESVGKGVMKLLILDRGYIDGSFIGKVKLQYGAEVLIPLRSNMETFTDAKRIAEFSKGPWSRYAQYTRSGVQYVEEVTVVEQVQLWDACPVALHISIMRITGSDGSIRYWGLASTFMPKDAKETFQLYELRTQIEERHRQLKVCWKLNGFSSPDTNLVEAHVMFTLLTYTLIQLYLNKQHLAQLARKTIASLQQEEQLGNNSVIVYSQQYFAVFDLDDYTEIIVDLEEPAHLRLQKWIKQFKQRPRSKGG